MFRHPDSHNKLGDKKDFNLDIEIDQSIRYFKVPAVKEKTDVLNFLLNDISGLKIIKPQKSKVRRLYVAIGSIASAACLLLFLLYFAFSNENYSGVQGDNITYYLPDHSKVVLSPNSQIRFNKLFLHRNVSLLGEAYFEVKKGSKFSVKTPNGEVRVLGTRFSVADNNDGFVVFCYEGKVAVKYGKEERQLLAGNRYVGSEHTINTVDIKENPFPTYLYFDHTFTNTNLSDIIPILEKHFGVTIYSNVPVDKRFSGTIHSNNIKEVIDTICTSMDISFVQVGETKYLIQYGKI